MNQGKLDMASQEMSRVNTDILGISELKWMEMGEFHSDDCISLIIHLNFIQRTTVGKNSLEEMN